ncbi:MAG: hypothetical protein M9894_26040 [Planctomycetes bacterium]|nr:hypothetical protein [Planctomycetota bacterium]
MVVRRRVARWTVGWRRVPRRRSRPTECRLFEEALAWCHGGHAQVTWAASTGCKILLPGAPPVVGEGRSFVEAYLACRRALERR